MGNILLFLRVKFLHLEQLILQCTLTISADDWITILSCLETLGSRGIDLQLWTYEDIHSFVKLAFMLLRISINNT